jgi:hypothetical protein
VATHDKQEPPEWKKRGAAVELEAGVRKLAEKLGERNVGALIVLVRVRDKVLGSTAGSPQRRRGGGRAELWAAEARANGDSGEGK